MKVTTDYVFFWKEYLSNWYTCNIKYDNIVWPSSEHIFMAMKAKLFNDKHIYNLISLTPSPAEAKRLGKLVKNFDSNVWDQHKFNLMFEANCLKYEQNPHLLRNLLILGQSRYFVEASPYDKIWGIGLNENDPDILDSSKWKGQNLLGQVLDKVVNKYK